MNEVTLTRRDPARNLHRYYRLDVQPDLFGAWCLIREWGRIGQGGQARFHPLPDRRSRPDRPGTPAPPQGAARLWADLNPSSFGMASPRGFLTMVVFDLLSDGKFVTLKFDDFTNEDGGGGVS